MKINWSESCGKELKMVKNGGCFLHDDVLYIKTDTEEQQPDPDFTKIMAVDLEDGIVDYFFSDTIVIPIEAEINFEGNYKKKEVN